MTVSDQEIRRSIELLFYAYRDFVAVPDKILAKYGFGRAHHRVLYFVGRNPGITVGELCGILKITKQSLNRVLSQLLEKDFVRQDAGAHDRRLRHLYLTTKGAKLENRLFSDQRDRMANAFAHAGGDAREGFEQVLRQMINHCADDAVIEK